MCLKDLGGNFDRWELRLRTRGYSMGEVVRLIQFGSICQIFTEHVLYQDAVPHPLAVRPGPHVPLALSEGPNLSQS